MSFLLLSILLILTFASFWRDKKQFEIFKSSRHTIDRQKFFKRWTIEPFLLYGLLSLIILWFLGQLNSLSEMPDFLKNVSQSISSSKLMDDSGFLSSLIKGLLISLVPSLLIGSTLVTILGAYQNKKPVNQTIEEESNFRNLAPLIPRNYRERWWGAILSLNAGFSEEIFFRLLAPILIYNVTGSTVLAILCSTLWFGLAHFYQGVGGVVVTFLVGLLLFGIYIITQSIWMTIFVHAVIDLNGLVLGPWLQERFAKKRKSL